MTLYKSIPVVVEARRFDGSGASGLHILKWLEECGIKSAWFHEQTPPYTLNGNTYQSPGWQAQLDLGIPHVKVAEAGDYVIRGTDDKVEARSRFRVLTEEQFEATYANPCATCSGPVRETVGMVCVACGHDYLSVLKGT